MPAACSRPDFPRSLCYEETRCHHSPLFSKSAESPPIPPVKSKISNLMGGGLVGLLFILIGSAAIYFSWGSYGKRQYVLDMGVQTDATVVELIRSESSSGGKRHKPGRTHYYPVMSFTDTRGCPQRIQSEQDYYLAPGTRTQVAYLPENPLRMEILPPKGLLLLQLSIGGGGLFCLGGLGIILTSLRQCFKN